MRGGDGLAVRDRAGLGARHPLVDEIEHHRSAGLRALPDRNRCLCTDLAGFGLAIAETTHIGDRRAGGAHGVGGVKLRHCACGAVLPVGSSASTIVNQNAIRKRKNMT